MTIKGKVKIDDAFGIIKKRIDDAQNYLVSSIKQDTDTLKEVLTLGSNWDNPFSISKAVDNQAHYYAQWGTQLAILRKEKAKLEAKYKAWASEKKQKIRDALINRGKKKGLTDKQAIGNVTISMVDDDFNVRYKAGTPAHKMYIQPLQDIDFMIEETEIIVSAFKQRKEMLTSLVMLVNKMIDNNLLVIKPKRK